MIDDKDKRCNLALKEYKPSSSSLISEYFIGEPTLDIFLEEREGNPAKVDIVEFSINIESYTDIDTFKDILDELLEYPCIKILLESQSLFSDAHNLDFTLAKKECEGKNIYSLIFLYSSGELINRGTITNIIKLLTDVRLPVIETVIDTSYVKSELCMAEVISRLTFNYKDALSFDVKEV